MGFLIRYGQSEQNIFILNKTPSKKRLSSDVKRTRSTEIERAVVQTNGDLNWIYKKKKKKKKKKSR